MMPAKKTRSAGRGGRFRGGAVLQAIGEAARLVDRVQHFVQRNQPRPGKQRPRRRGFFVHGLRRGEEAGTPVGPRFDARVGAGRQAVEGAGKRGRQLGLQGVEKGSWFAQVREIRLQQQPLPLRGPGGGIQQVGVEGPVA